MTTKNIQSQVCKSEVLKGNIPCENVSYVFHGECDVLSLLKSGYISEYEVKISRSDFKAEKKKTHKWLLFDSRHERNIPNYFSYVCPDGLIKVDELPDYAGLIYAYEGHINIIKKPKILHRYKKNTLELMGKFLRVKNQREYLGSCLLTYNNKPN